MNSFWLKILSRDALINLAYLVIFALALQAYLGHMHHIFQNPPTPTEPGTRFHDFRPHIQGKPEIGYMTNKNMSEEKNDGVFLMAQFALTPTILKLNDLDQDHHLLDMTTPAYVVFTLRKLKAAPRHTSRYGLVLTERLP